MTHLMGTRLQHAFGAALLGLGLFRCGGEKAADQPIVIEDGPDSGFHSPDVISMGLDGPSEPEGGSSPDADDATDGGTHPDGDLDPDANDGSDFVSRLVWTQNTRDFDLRRWGGLSTPRTDHDECTQEDISFYFTYPNLLSARGCEAHRNVSWDIELTEYGRARLLGTLDEMRTVATPTGPCIADVPFYNLTTFGQDGGRYYSDWYPPTCGYAPFGDPVRGALFDVLYAVLTKTLRDTCVDARSDAGVPDASLNPFEIATTLAGQPLWESSVPPVLCRLLATGDPNPVRDH